MILTSHPKQEEGAFKTSSGAVGNGTLLRAGPRLCFWDCKCLISCLRYLISY